MKFQIRLITGLFLLLAGTWFLFHDGPGNFAPRSIKEIWDLGHIIYFALMVYLLINLGLFKKLSLSYQWLIFLAITLILGTLIEVLQYGTTRTPDLADISRDMTGGLLILSFHHSMLAPSRRLFIVLVRLFAAIVFVIHLIPLAIALIDESTARSQFPILSDFETSFEMNRWGGGASKEVVKFGEGQNNSVLKIGLTTSMYSGVGMEYLPADWSGYQSVNLRIYQPADEVLKITVRIHDFEHVTGLYAQEYDDRFNRSYTLHKGWNNIKILLSEVQSMVKTRKMDLTQIRDISFFAISLPQPRVIYLDSIGLQ